jgi:CheY-like chemotaxis protein
MSFGAPILVIDDDPAFVEAMQAMLDAAGHTTAAARNAFHGLKLAREINPAVIVCDVMMPNMNGVDVLRALASDPATARIPRVLVSGRGDADMSCAHAFLQKPFEPKDIVAVIAKVSSGHDETVTKRIREATWRG